MSVENRYRRKKTFKSNERSELVEASNAAACKQDEVTTLNVRRSSRKPKPKRHDNEGNVSTGPEETEKPSGEGGADAKMTFAGVESGEIFLGTGIRRETRKTYQNYLEKLGYNTDFSKISPADSPTHPIKAKAGSSRKTINKQSKTEEKAATKRSRDSQNEKSLSVEEKTVMTKIRASARTPKPRRTFALLEDDATAHSKDTSDTCKPGRIVQNAFDFPDLSSETEVKLPRVVKTQKSSSDKRNQEQRLLKGQKQMASARQEVLTTAPLSKHDIDEAEVLSDADDSSHPRTSTRIRIPKRKFSLIEEVPPTEMKKQKIMSPEHCGDIEVCKDNKVLEPNNTSMQSPSSLVVKRSDTRKQRANRRKGNLNESRLSPSKEKDKHIGKKMEVSNNSHSEIENKPGSGRSKQKIVKEPIIKKLKVLKETPVVGKSKKIKKNKDIKNEDVSSQKNTVRKEDNDNLKKGKMQNEGKETKNDSKEHIVLKLTIPHGSPRSEEKEKMHDKQHHKHHHHHRHKKEKKDRYKIFLNFISTVEPEFYNIPFYSHLSRMTRFSATDDL